MKVLNKKNINCIIMIMVILISSLSSYAVVGTPSNINYSISTSGTFLYCNNPESVKKDNLADDKYGKHSVLQETVKAGTVRFFAEHNNFKSGTPYCLCLGVKNRFFTSNFENIEKSFY
ncbi:MAG: hypothetical protein Q8942_06470 [Bacillota bacterium]|nr:hypothetical protein [Bacillota bacterium]